MSVTLRHNQDLSRYEALVDGQVASYASYQLNGDVVAFDHTVTEPEFGGQGLASKVAAFSLEDVRAAGRKVIPVCSFYVTYLRRYPEEYGDLLP